ncbi:hypothetical protein PACTADRAFT_47745 [Pachysolen tannophilus NRRL Y-2460]|uniref:Rgp1-domain-containing protein n=1 Tax=Pachysolen tannophilus NRRL Y-2460 TaxID=669874 RepID=A0A1E4U1M4_PACTA|nr:hypothetical protein PACTADRAFT_47745 [Pachysolen tannophilus NRRL Y-2460]
MITHSIFNQLINESIRLELIYENYPVFAGNGNDLSLILRFKYIGKLPAPTNADNVKDNTHLDNDYVATDNTLNAKGNDEDNSWSSIGKRLSFQLSNTTRSLFLAELENINEEEESAKNKKDESLLAGYSQIFGYYTLNDEIFDIKSFKEIQSKTVIGGKLGGINGLDFNNKDDDGYWNTFSSGFGALFSAGVIPDDDGANVHKRNNDESMKSKIIPIFSSTQSILFSEISFKNLNSLTKEFYTSIQLPKFLPPSYNSLSSLKIVYNLVVGFQMFDENNKLVNKTLYFPLEIQPFINQFGQQPIFDLLQPKLNYMCQVKVLDLNDSAGKNSPDRKATFRSIRRRLGKDIPSHNRRSSTISVSSFNIEEENSYYSNGNPDQKLNIIERQKFIDFIAEMNKNNDLIGIQEKFETQFLSEIGNDIKEDVRENLINIMTNPSDIAKKINEFNKSNNDKKEIIHDHDIKFHSQIPIKPQLNFILKRNAELIATISLSKSIVTSNEILKVHLNMKNSKIPITGLITKIIKVEKFNDTDYIRNDDESTSSIELNSNYELETNVNEIFISSFNENDELSFDMLIPNDKVRNGQFKTNLLEVKYVLLFKFILLNRDASNKSSTDEAQKTKEEDTSESEKNYEFVNIYNDSKGALYKAVDHLDNGMEFYCKIPLILLSNYEQDFGYIVNC